MTDYSRVNDFSAKDGLTTGNPSKLIKGSEVDDDFDAIVTAVATKANKAVPATTGNLASLSATGDLQDSGGTGGVEAGTAMLFYQSAAPTGWTKNTTASLNDHALKIVTSEAWVSGTQGTTAFSSVFGAAGGSTTLTAAQSGLPAHTHTAAARSNQIETTGGAVAQGYAVDSNTGSTGGTSASSGHTHTTPSIKYLDIIIATKD